MTEQIYDIIKPLYLGLLHGNFVRMTLPDEESFKNSLKTSLGTEFHGLYKDMIDGHWRERLTGAWLSGLCRRAEHQDRIGELLIKSETTYAGQGLCFALTSFATERSIEYLTKYLEIWLPQTKKYYDQDWVMSGLTWLDKTNNTNFSNRFRGTNSLWEKYTLASNSHRISKYDESELAEKQLSNLIGFYDAMNTYMADKIIGKPNN